MFDELGDDSGFALALRIPEKMRFAGRYQDSFSSASSWTERAGSKNDVCACQNVPVSSCMTAGSRGGDARLREQ